VKCFLEAKFIQLNTLLYLLSSLINIQGMKPTKGMKGKES